MLTVMHLTAAAFVAAFIALYVIELRAQRKEGTSGILLTVPQRLLLSASKEPALLFRDKRLDVRGLLKQCVPVTERLLERLNQSDGTDKEDKT